MLTTFSYSRSYEPEEGMTYRILQIISNHPDDTDAFIEYLALREFSFTKSVVSSNDKSIDIFSSLSADGEPELVLTSSQFFEKASVAVIQSDFPSFDWYQESPAVRELEISNFLRDELRIQGLRALRLGVRTALRGLIGINPLQYTIRFENGDTLTFSFISPFRSLAFSAVLETAMDKEGNRLTQSSGSGRSSGGGSDSGGGASFGSGIQREITTVCVRGFTGTSPNLVNQGTFCFLVFL